MPRLRLIEGGKGSKQEEPVSNEITEEDLRLTPGLDMMDVGKDIQRIVSNIMRKKANALFPDEIDPPSRKPNLSIIR